MIETDFEIIASTTASILEWIAGHREHACSELGQIEIGRRVKSAMERAVKLNEEEAMEQTSIEMPHYKCHKEVHALKIKSIHAAPCQFPIGLTTCGGHPSECQHSGSRSSIVPPAGRHAYDGDILIIPEDARYASIGVDPDYIQKHNPQPGGYYVVYEDGYKSFSPAEAFESGYTLVK